jgi:hypothetical protein
VSVKPFQNPSDLPEELHFITDYMQEMWEKGWISWVDGFYCATNQVKTEIITDHWAELKNHFQADGLNLMEFNAKYSRKFMKSVKTNKTLNLLLKRYSYAEIGAVLSKIAEDAIFEGKAIYIQHIDKILDRFNEEMELYNASGSLNGFNGVRIN